MPCKIEPIAELSKASKAFDSIVVVDNSLPQLRGYFEQAENFDQAFHSEISCFKCDSFDAVIIYSPIPELDDYDDVRKYSEAAKKGMARAVKAGAQSPVFVLPSIPKFKNGDLVALLGALEFLYVPVIDLNHSIEFILKN